MKEMAASDSDSVSGKLYGFPFIIRGVNMVIFLTLVAVTSYTIYFLSVVVSREHVSIADRINQQTEVMDRQTEVLSEQNYILLADEAEVKEIKKRYRMPKSLRLKLSEQ